MRNQSNNVRSVVKNILTPAAFACIVLATAAPYNAQAEGTKEKKEPAKTAIDVKYLGLRETQPIFQVDINNVSGEELFVVLKDDEGGTLYKEKFNEKVFSKKFQINTGDGLNSKVTMSVFSKNEKTKEVYLIGNETKVVEDVVVTRIN